MADGSKKRPWWLRILRGIAIAIVVLCLLLGAGAWWLLGTSSGANWLVSTALPYAQDNMPESLQLDVQDIDAKTLAHLRIGRITLADAQGVWFATDGLVLRWHPTALLKGLFHAEEISATRIHFIRPPIGDETPTTPLREQMESLQVTLRQLPDTLEGIAVPPLKIDRLAVQEIALEAFAQKDGSISLPTNLTLEGHADFSAVPGNMHIELHSLEGVKTSAIADLSGPTDAVELQVRWREQTGGLLGTLMQLQTPAPVALNIDAAMKDGQFQPAIDALVGEARLLRGTIALPVAESPLMLDMTLSKPSLLAPLASFNEPIAIRGELTKAALHVYVTTNSMTLSESQSLMDLVMDATGTFGEDPLLSLDAGATATLIQPEAEPMPLKVTLMAAGDADSIKISKFTAKGAGAELSTQATLDLAKGTASATGKASAPQADATFKAQASSLWDTPKGNLTLMVEQIKQALPAPLDQILATPLTLTAKTTPTDGTLPDVHIAIEGQNLNGEAKLHPNAQAEQTLAEADITVGGLPLPLNITAQHRAVGDGHVRAQSRELLVDTDYAMTDDAVQLDNMRVDGGSDLQLAGKLQLNTASGLADGAFKGHIKSTAPLRSLGLTTPDVKASKGAIELALKAPNNVQTAAVSFESGSVTLDNAAVLENATLNAQASLPADKPIQLDGELKAETISYPVPLDSFVLSAKGTQSAIAWKTQATHEVNNTALNADGKLTLEQSITLVINTLSAQWKQSAIALDSPATVIYGSDKIALQNLALTLNEKAKLAANAELTNQAVKGEVNIAKLSLKDVPVGPLASVHGVVDGTLSLSGAPTNPQAQMEMTIDGLQQNYPEMTNLRKQPLTVKLRGALKQQEVTGQLSINAPDAESFAAANVALPVTVSLKLDALQFAPKGTFTADLRADLILAPFLPLLMPDGIYGAGHMVADMSATGALDSPNLNGTIDLHSGQVEVLQAGTLVDDLTLKLVAKGKRISISEGSANDGDKGTLSFSGDIDLTPSLPMDVQASLKQFIAVRHPSATATVTGDTTLKGDLSDALLKGDWTIDSAKITIAAPGGGSVADMKVVEVASLDEPLETREEVEEENEEAKAEALKERRRERPFDRNLNLDLKIHAENQIFLDGFGLTAELKGKVAVVGTAARPKMYGKMETVRGRWEFFGRTFEITRGEAILSEQNLTAPLINLRAEAEADDVTAIAMISGSTNNPKIEFSSIPALPKDEILSRVMFGENLNSISPYQALQLADMLRSLSGSGNGGSLNPLSKLQDTLGIDELKINNESGDSEDVTVGVGKYVQENVYLEVEGGAGENSGKVSVEVDLTPRISVETEARQNAESAIRLNYKYDY